MMPIVLLAIIIATEIVFVAGVVLNNVPVHIDPAYLNSFVNHYRRTYQPNHNFLLYEIWFLAAVAIFAGFWFIRERSKQKWSPTPLLLFHGIILLLMAHSGFAIATMNAPIWSWPLFYLAFATGMLATIFWPECRGGIVYLEKCYQLLKKYPMLGAILAGVLIFLIIYMPDPKLVVAWVYMEDYFHNWDVQLSAGAYGMTKGLLPCVDINTTYGFGAVVLTSKLMSLMGGFDYSRMVSILMWSGIIYFIAWFLLLRELLVSSLLALAAVIIGIRLNMFHLMVEPFIWSEPMASVFRYCFDAGFFWMIWMHLKTRREIFLWAAGFFVSLGLFHVISNGTWMLMTLGLYAMLTVIVPSLAGTKQIVRLAMKRGALLMSILVLTLCWFYLSVGGHMFQMVFWQNLLEFTKYYSQGVHSAPILTLIERKFVLLGIIGLLMPILYAMTFLYTAGCLMQGKTDKRIIFAGLLGFYGLGVHCYFMVMASQWGSICLPAVFLVFFWTKEFLSRLSPSWQKKISWGLLGVSIYCLFTTQMFNGYPNLLNFSANPIVDARTDIRVGPEKIPNFQQIASGFPEGYKLSVNSLGEADEGYKFEKDFADDQDLKSYYDTETSWAEDTALIDRLTPAGSRVPVISSFETLMLQRADRLPFFYDSPIVNSYPLRSRNFMVTYLENYSQLRRVLMQMEIQKPEYVFMERKFLTPQVPQAYLYDFEDLIAIINYVRVKYQPISVGKYLVAMKRL